MNESRTDPIESRSAWTRLIALASALSLAISLALAVPARAEEEPGAVPTPAAMEDEAAPEAESGKIDLTLHHPDNPDNWILPSLRFDTVSVTGANAWGGNTKFHIGNKSNGWMELGLVPGLDAQYSLGDNGTLHARASGVYSTTQLGLDWGGSNFIDGETKKPEEITLEDAFVQWSSGEVFSGLGKDAVTLSIGSQQYNVGNGFLFGNAGSDGGKRGGYWLGLRKAFELAGIARVQSGGFMGEAVYLRSDDLGGDHTETGGANLEYDFASLLGVERFKLGAGYWNVFQSDNLRRDGLNVVSIRLDAAPLASLPGFGVNAEFVKEKNQWRNDSWAFQGTLSYDAAKNEVPLKPFFSYRFATFSGDDQAGDNDNRFDPLYYTFNDWNEWYIGEIVGEWVAGNSNINANVFRFRVSPTDSLSINLFYIYLRLNEKQGEVSGPGGRPVDPRVVAVEDKDLSHEFDLIADWAVNDYLSVSTVGAMLVPIAGSKDFYGNDEIWLEFLLNTSIRF